MLFRGGLIFGNLFLLNDKYVPFCIYVSMNTQFALPVKLNYLTGYKGSYKVEWQLNNKI